MIIKFFRASNSGIQAVLKSSKVESELKELALTTGIHDEMKRQMEKRGIDTKQTVNRTKTRVKIGVSSDDSRFNYVAARSQSLREAVLSKIQAAQRR